MQQGDPHRAIREAELAERLGVSLSTVRRWRLTRTGPIHPLRNLGKLIRYSEAELNRYLEAKR